MPSVYLRFAQEAGTDQWYTLKEYGTDAEGYISWLDIHYNNGQVQRVVRKPAKASLQDWQDYVNLVGRTASGTVIGTSLAGPFGAIAGFGIGLASFFAGKEDIAEGYYEIKTAKFVLKGSIDTKKLYTDYKP